MVVVTFLFAWVGHHHHLKFLGTSQTFKQVPCQPEPAPCPVIGLETTTVITTR